jgi:hypothetical protein
MNLRIFGRSVPLTTGRLVAIAIAIVGVILLILAYYASAQIAEIGETPNPLLQQRIAQLEDQRDMSVVAGVGFAFLGLFGVAILGEANAPRSISKNQMISTAKAASDIIRSLQVLGNAVYLPAKHGLDKERVFIPGKNGPVILPMALSDDLVLSFGKDGSSPGISLEPLGVGMLDEIEMELGTPVAGVGTEAAEGTLQMMKHGLGLLRDFHFKDRDGKTIMRVEYKDLLDACRAVRKDSPNTCRQMACIGCSCIFTAAARATGKAVIIEGVDNTRDTVVYTLELREW